MACRDVDPRVAAEDAHLFRVEVALVLYMKDVFGFNDADTSALIAAARNMVYNKDTEFSYLISLTQFQGLRERIVEKYQRERQFDKQKHGSKSSCGR